MAGFLLFPIATAIGLLAGHIGGEQRGWIADPSSRSHCVDPRFLAAQVKYWFWVAVAAFAVTDLLVVSLINWSFTADWNGHTMSGLAVLDFGAMMAIVYGLYRLVYGPPAALFEEDPGDLPDYAERNIDL